MFVFIALVAIAGGCADSHQLIRPSQKSQKLERNVKFYVSMPRDGRYGQITYHGSGANATQIVTQAFAHYSSRIESASSFQTFEEALGAAKGVGATYLVIPVILEWEDRATEWSGIPDRASINISITDARTSETIDSVTVKGKSGLATFGGDHPQDLLPKPVGEYVKSLFE